MRKYIIPILYAAIVSGEEEEREVVVSLLNLSLQDENYEKEYIQKTRVHEKTN